VRLQTVLTIPAATALAVFVFPGSISVFDLRPRAYSPETAALKAIQTLNTAQVQYYSQFGRFARLLTELGPPASGAANASAADLISSELASGEKQGYRFTLAGTGPGYSITAAPTAFGSTGSRTFYSDQSLVIRENHGPEPATANSREVGPGSKKGGTK